MNHLDHLDSSDHSDSSHNKVTSVKVTSAKVTPAKVTWQKDELGNLIPVSDIFDDVYYSLADGLAESRYVFIDQNKLPERFEALFQSFYNVEDRTINNTFSIGELGFGTGLNVLITWQLWRHLKTQVKKQVKAQTKALIKDQIRKQSNSITKIEKKGDEYKSHVDQDQPNHNLYVRPPRLHIISTEKHPLTLEDLSRSLESWKQRDTSLTPLINTLLDQYPTLIAGCHRLHLDSDVTLDLWLGDASISLNNLANSYQQSTQKTSNNNYLPLKPHLRQAHIDAWYLDGFAPSRNESLWADEIFHQVSRLSKTGTTLATYSSAGIVKRGLISAGFEIKKVKGFGPKRQMLTAVKLAGTTANTTDYANQSLDGSAMENTQSINHVAVIGAGVSGLMTAWSLAQRGIRVSLLDKSAPLAGASGNPRALLAPKMTPLAHVAEHLHTLSYLYSIRRYQKLNQLEVYSHQSTDNNNQNTQASSHQNPHFEENTVIAKDSNLGNLRIFEQTATLDLLLKANVDEPQIVEYPSQMATTLASDKAKDVSGLKQQDLTKNLYLPQAGLVNPEALANTILSHPNISFIQSAVDSIKTQIIDNNPSKVLAKDTDTDTDTEKYDDLELDKDTTEPVLLSYSNKPVLTADAVVIATAYQSQSLDARIFEFRKIRGQLSWFAPTEQQLKALPKLPLKYGGYCAVFGERINANDGYHYELGNRSGNGSRSGQNNSNDTTNSTPTNQPLFLLGASFVRNDTSIDIRKSEHAINRDKLVTAIPELKAVITSADDATEFAGWQARVGIRAQTPDYHPVVGQVDEEGFIWTLSGMGSKGFAFAPLCAEALADMMSGQFTPFSKTLLDRLSPHRKSLQQPLSP